MSVPNHTSLVDAARKYSTVQYARLASGQAIGKSSNAPSPNLKKLTIPASTAATTTIFFPAFIIANGLGLRGCCCCFDVEDGGVEAGDEEAHVHANSRRKNDGGGDEGTKADGGGVGGASGLDGCRVRRRGTGGGSSGKPSNRA